MGGTVRSCLRGEPAWVAALRGLVAPSSPQGTAPGACQLSQPGTAQAMPTERPGGESMQALCKVGSCSS